jgi:peptidylprolyl isomerase/peptidyl-prolyl cis-trans isomerase D
MGAMNKLRENTGVILWILVLSFGVIWTLQDSDVFEAVNQTSRNVATVNGEAISNQEFQNAVQQQRRQVQQQTDGQITAQMEQQIRQRAYDQLINSQLLEMEMQRLGISVTDAEVEQMVFGENPHPVIRQQFADSTGQINYQMLQSMAQNPQAEAQWIQLEQFLREQRRQQKMSSLVQSTVFVSEEDIKRYHWRQNAQADVEYAALRYAAIPSDSISVSESDLRDYYDENREDFRREKTISLDYVSLPKTPTAEDTAAVVNDLEGLRDAFANAEDDSLFLAENASARSFSANYQTRDELPPAVAQAVYEDPEPGRIVGPVFTDRLAHLVKIRDLRPAEGQDEPAVQIADLAFELTASRATLTDKENTLDDVAFYASEDGNFQEEAERRDLTVEQVQAEATQSTVPGLGQSPALTNFMESAEAGDISDVLELDDVFVVAKATNVQPEGYRSFEDVKAEIRPRVELQKKKEIQLRRMRQALSEADFQDLPEVLNTELRSQSNVTFSTESVPGIGRDPAFAGTVFGLDEGETSSVIEGNNAAFVVRVTTLTEPDALTDAERQQIRQVLLQQRRRQISSQWIAALREDAQIEDNRGQFR